MTRSQSTTLSLKMTQLVGLHRESTGPKIRLQAQFDHRHHFLPQNSGYAIELNRCEEERRGELMLTLGLVSMREGGA